MERTADSTARDRSAYRDSYFLTEALNADIDFQPYWRERRFQSLREALDARLAAKAGSCAYGASMRAR